MTRAALDWLASTSDWLSPLVVKEVRQAVRGRELHYSFGVCLLVGLAVAFFGSADALTGNGTSGRWTFGALMGCLTLVGLAVVPLGTFGALRNERLEQTLELITLTALSPRRVVIGKLLAQGVKLATLFAGLAPFIAMSFLLGGIDFGTILVWLPVLFMWSLWACAACLFLSSLFTTRAMSGAVLGGVVIVMFLFLVVFGLPRAIFLLMTRGGMGGGGMAFSFGMTAGSQSWLALAIATTACLATMVNLVLLAENRLSLPTDNRVTALRVGFFGQFLLIAAWTLSFVNESAPVRFAAGQALAVLGGLHLAAVAMFTVSEDLVVSRRVLLQMKTSRWRRLLVFFRPGGGYGAIYVLAQMVLFLGAAWLLRPAGVNVRVSVATCGYICLFTGLPAVLFRFLRPARAASFNVRVAALVLLSIALVLPDILYYVLWQPAVFDLKYGARHLLNPIRTLANWPAVEVNHGFAVPFAAGLVGLLSYFVLIGLGMRMTARPDPIDPHSSAPAAVEPGRANVSY